MTHYRRLGLLLLLAAAFVPLATRGPVHRAFIQALEEAGRVINAHAAVGLLVFAALSAISAMVFFLSTAAIVPVAVFAWGKPATLALLWASWMLGAVASYVVGRRPGRRLASWLVSERRLAHYEEQLPQRLSFPLVLLFQLAVPSEIPGYVLGALRYPFGKYLGARALAEVPFAVGTVYLGEAFVRGHLVPLVMIAGLGLTLSGAALYALRRRIAGAGS